MQRSTPHPTLPSSDSPCWASGPPQAALPWLMASSSSSSSLIRQSSVIQLPLLSSGQMLKQALLKLSSQLACSTCRALCEATLCLSFLSVLRPMPHLSLSQQHHPSTAYTACRMIPIQIRILRWTMHHMGHMAHLISKLQTASRSLQEILNVQILWQTLMTDRHMAAAKEALRCSAGIVPVPTTRAPHLLGMLAVPGQRVRLLLGMAPVPKSSMG